MSFSWIEILEASILQGFSGDLQDAPQRGATKPFLLIQMLITCLSQCTYLLHIQISFQDFSRPHSNFNPVHGQHFWQDEDLTTAAFANCSGINSLLWPHQDNDYQMPTSCLRRGFSDYG